MIMYDAVRGLFRKLRMFIKASSAIARRTPQVLQLQHFKNTIYITMHKPTKLLNREFNTLVHSKPSGNNDPASGERNTKHTFCHTHDAKL